MTPAATYAGEHLPESRSYHEQPPTDNKIGQLNGPWSFMFRLALASYPLVLGWCVWVTVQQFDDIAFRNAGNRFTATEAAQMESRINTRINDLPPVQWQKRVEAMENKQNEILQALGRIEGRLTK